MKRVGLISGSRIDHRGNWFPSLQRGGYKQDDFEGDILADQWDVDLGGGGESVAIVAGQNGLVALTTVAGDNFHASMARELNLSSALSAGIEAMLKLDDITNCTIEMGLVQAKSMAQGRAFDDYELAATLPTPVATDAAVIGWDPTDSPLHPHLTGVSVDSGGVAAAVDLAVDLLNLTFVIVKVQLDALGTARYYVNNNLLGTQLLAIEPATPLTPWLAISNKAAAIARVHTVDYASWWQRRV